MTVDPTSAVPLTVAQLNRTAVGDTLRIVTPKGVVYEGCQLLSS